MPPFSIAAIKHQAHEMAARIHAVQIAAYQQEAALLGVSDFPPLARTVEDLIGSRELFFGAFNGEELLGVIGVEQQSDAEALISSLTVAPRFQRLGVGGALIAAVGERVTCTTIAVSTGAKNYPALALFREFGFVARQHKYVGQEQLEIVELSAERSNISFESRRSTSAAQRCVSRPPVRDHILVVGGTGMLNKASVVLAGQCSTLSSVARTERSLRALNYALASVGCTHHMLPLDWSDPEPFLDSISRHVKAVGYPSLVLAWLHQDSLGRDLAVAVSTESVPCDFFHVRGSSVADPMMSAVSLTNPFDARPSVKYHQVILGFRVDRSGSRWLHNSEISDGVLTAISLGQGLSVIGSIAPWTERPS